MTGIVTILRVNQDCAVSDSPQKDVEFFPKEYVITLLHPEKSSLRINLRLQISND
jgi:hypothetical protein